jgi:hypothetical protein
MEKISPREGGKYMPITYVIGLAIVVLLLCAAVRLHMSFGLYRNMNAKKMVNVEIQHVGRAPHLHDFIFRRY